MKICTQCGKEYGDTISQCPLDGQPLLGTARPTATPPPLPPKSALPPLLSGTAVPPLLATTYSELEQQVLAGGRFVIFHYCISVIVLTFKRPSEIIYLAPGEDGAKPALTNSLLAFFAGWWGIPWGPIWTIAALVKNAGGGTDVTQAVLAQHSNPARAAQIMARRRIVPPRGRGLRNLRIGMISTAIAVPLLVLAPIWIIALTSDSSRSRAASSPEYANFREGNAIINHYQGSSGYGNTPKAVDVAEAFTKLIKKRRNLMFAAAQPGRISAGTADFVSCCELYDSQCAIIVNVPDLRQFDSEAKRALGDVAWGSAQEALREKGVARPGMKLAVGLRGVLMYDRVLIGNVVTNADVTDTGLIETVTGSEVEQRLYPFFQRPEQSAATADAQAPSPKLHSVTKTNQ